MGWKLLSSIEIRVPKVSAENRKPVSAIGAATRLAALGVVFGDIGTSPLYTLKTVLNLTGANPDAATTLGALSLILWTLFVVTTVKYVNFAMRIDNDGEGGIIANLALIGVKKHHRPAIVAAGLFGAALIYGDGTITPAISVLSALEGMEQIAPSLQTYVLPASVVVLLALFALQPLGTGKIGRSVQLDNACVVRSHGGAWGVRNNTTSWRSGRDKSALWHQVSSNRRRKRLFGAWRSVSLRDGG